MAFGRGAHVVAQAELLFEDAVDAHQHGGGVFALHVTGRTRGRDVGARVRGVLIVAHVGRHQHVVAEETAARIAHVGVGGVGVGVIASGECEERGTRQAQKSRPYEGGQHIE